MNKTKIACVEDAPKLRKHWVDELNKHDDFEVIFEVDDETGLYEHLSHGLLPDFLVLDLRLHDKLAGLEILEKIRADNLAVHVIVCSNYTEEDIMARTLMLGARAFVLKGAPSDITKAIRMVQQEGIFVTDYALEALLKVNTKLQTKVEEWQRRAEQGGNSANLPKLDNQQDQLRMLKLLCSGLTFKEIADKEKITEREVERRRDRLCVIFDAVNRYDLIYKAAKLGLDRHSV